MNQLLKRPVIKFLSWGPTPSLIQRVKQPRSLTVVNYHGVIDGSLPYYDTNFMLVDAFRRQVAYLRENFELLTMSQAVTALNADAIASPAAVITLDDGYQNNFDFAFPVLREFDAPAIIYLVTDIIGTENTFWFTRLLAAIGKTTENSLDWGGQQFSLTDPVARAGSSNRLLQLLKYRPARDLERQLQVIEDELEVEATRSVSRSSPLRMLDAVSIEKMLTSHLVEFGAHTCSHPILSLLTADQQESEIVGSLRSVEALTGKRCRHFAYPNGQPGDYDDESVRILQEAGVASAVTTSPGPVSIGTPAHEMNRYAIAADISLDRFKLMVHHVV